MRMKLHTISALLSATAFAALTIPSQAVTIDDLKAQGLCEERLPTKCLMVIWTQVVQPKASARTLPQQFSRNSELKKSIGLLRHSARLFPD